MANHRKYNLKRLFTEPAPWEIDIEAFLRARRAKGPGWARRMNALQKARRKKRQREVMAAREAAARARWEATPGSRREREAASGRWAKQGLLVGCQTVQLLAAMQPGTWYATTDLRRLTGWENRTLQPLLRQRLERRGMVEQGLNPEWRPEMLGKAVPKKLWRLTLRGEQVATLARLLG